MNIKIYFKYLLMVIIGIITLGMGCYNVEAATFTVDRSTSNRIYFSNYTKYTYHNKKLDNDIAYCTQLNYMVPANGTTYNTTRNQYYTKSYVTGVLINHMKNNVGTDMDGYLKTQYALNCYLKDNGYYSSVCSDYTSLIADAEELVSKNYRYQESSSKQSLPSISISGNRSLSSSGKFGEYVSQKLDISGLVTTYGGNNVKYVMKVNSSSAGTAYICSSNSYNASTCMSQVTIDNKSSYPFYVVVKDGGVNGGNVSITISGSNSSTYHSSVLWSTGNSAYQQLATYKPATISRSITTSATFNYAASNKYFAALTKVNEFGNRLDGANMKLFTADKEDGTGNKKDICSITSGSSCSLNDLVPGDSHGYENGRYLCFEETKAPLGYIKIPGVCSKIAIGEDHIYYYKDGAKVEESEYNKYNNSKIYCVSRTTEEIDDTYIKDKIGEIGNSTDIKDGTCEVITNVNKQSICIMNDGSLNYYKSGTDEYTNNCEKNDELVVNTGTKYCVSRTSEEIDDTYIGEVVANGLESNENLVVGECEETPKIYSTSICLYDVKNKGYYGYNTDDYTEYCINKENYTFSKFQDAGGSYSITAPNTMNKVNISKKAITGTAEVAGATLAIYTTDSNGNCTDTLATALSFAYQPYIYKGTTGSTDESNDDDNFINVDNIENSGDSNTGGDNGTNGNEDDSSYVDPATNGLKWKSSHAPVTIYGLASGTYCLTEEIAPRGYEKVTTISKFSMDDEGNVELVDDGNGTSDLKDGTISLYNKLVELTISKKDIATSKELPGATMAICVASKNDDGKYELVTNYTGECTIVTLENGMPATWVSTKESHIVKGLSEGTYYLVEQIAPKGYAEAEAILFTVDSDGNVFDKDGKSVKNNKITMYDKILDEPKTGDTLMIIGVVIGVVAIGIVIFILNKKGIIKLKK